MSTITRATTAGLSSQEAQERLRLYGPNAIPEKQPPALLIFLKKLWGPVPWMLEATIALQAIMGRSLDVTITLILLLVNAGLSFVQESRAQNALDLLRRGLFIQSRVIRDGRWQLILAKELVPGDRVHVRVGDVVPADLHVLDGQVSVDQSMLTGESLAIEIAEGATAYAGSMIQRGEATAEVINTGSRSFYGKTAELVHTAETVSHMETIIKTIVKDMVLMNGVLILLVEVYALVNELSLTEMLPFILILLVASIPVALPATFTLASTLGSLELSKRGVLITRLSAIREIAGMDILCSDKTGTITCNQLALAGVHAFPPYTENEVLSFAAFASDDASQDSIDLAVLNAVRSRGLSPDPAKRLQFTPFDPKTKRTEAVIWQDEQTLHVIKGFPQTVAAMTQNSPDVALAVEALAMQGNRVLAVAAGADNAIKLIGLIGLQDPPREDSHSVIKKLQDLGVKVVMVTGDTLETAQAIAAQVGIRGRVCSGEKLRSGLNTNNMDYAIFAGVFPEDKFKLVQSLQRDHMVGMTGDGVNDAPALKQAEVGVAVANASDVAKAAASLVLTKPGLSDMLAAVEVGRCIYQRMLTYTLNKIIKTFQIGMFLSLGLLLTGLLITRPRLVLLLLLANDFVTMSIATDQVSFSRKPDHWNMRPLLLSALVLAFSWLIFSFGILLVAYNLMQLPLEELQTFIFVMLVFSGQANVYLVRERGHVWQSRPSYWLMISSIVDIFVVSLLATQGIFMTAIRPNLVIGLLIATMVYLTLLDFLKTQVFYRLNILSPISG